MGPIRPTGNPQVVHSGLARDEAVLLHLESRAYHDLNSIGSTIWDLVDGTRDIKALREQNLIR